MKITDLLGFPFNWFRQNSSVQPTHLVSPTTLYVCPTSHLDWDWINSFEQYYSVGYSPADNPVRYTLDQMIALLSAPSSKFCFSLAEMGYLDRYLQDNPQAIASLLGAGKRMCLMGGGITSPDNLVSHGEAFIRNYLFGTPIGLNGLRDPLAWLPDDFGHDPQLPVVLQAMGMKAVGISRVPGSVQGTPCAKPLSGGPSVAAQLENSNGLVFLWNARDGSQIICHFMPDTYSVSSANLGSFVSSYSSDQWNGSNMFVPVPGNDFATPTIQIQNDIDNYNKNPVNGVKAQMATFQDFINAVQSDSAGLGAPFTLRAANYWTGYFASRPALIILHNRATRELMAAESMSAILRIYSSLAASVGNALDSGIQRGWKTLLPSTHHDFITGTSPDEVYQSEQLPLLQLAVEQSVACRSKAAQLLASSIKATPQNDETPVVVVNSLGFQRGGVVELPSSTITRTTPSIRGPSGACTIQPLPNGGLLFQTPTIASLGWSTFYIESGTPPDLPLPPTVNDSAVLENDYLSVTLTRSSSWFITSFFDKQAARELVRPTMLANEIRIYSDNGNLYQFGNEPLQCPLQYGTFQKCTTTFQTVGTPVFIEYGPLRQRFAVTIEDTSSGYQFGLEYTLITGEPFLRMRTTGEAPPSSSVVTAFPLVSANGLIPDGLTHGTAYHWDDEEPERYWPGPTFQATHDFVLPTESTSNTPYVAAVYHGDVPAWCRNQGVSDTDPDVGTILGTLLRNTDGQQRGAAGTDSAIHTREYALRVPSGLGAPITGIPLQESLALSTPLFPEVQYTQLPLPSYMNESGTLASVTPSPLIVRAVRGQIGSGIMSPAYIPKPTGKTDSSTASTCAVDALEQPYSANGVPTSFVLRLYSPDATISTAQLSLPFQSTAQPITASLVTALEEAIPNGNLHPQGETVTVPTPLAITTVQIQTNRIYTAPNNGKGANRYPMFSKPEKLNQIDGKLDPNDVRTLSV